MKAIITLIDINTKFFIGLFAEQGNANSISMTN